MTHTNLAERVRKAKDNIKNYPDWVKASSTFQGGGVHREKPLDKKCG